jgi:hypothetical protein
MTMSKRPIALMRLACSPLFGYRRLRLKVSLDARRRWQFRRLGVPEATVLRLDLRHNPRVRLHPEEKQLHLRNNPAPLRRRAAA